MPWLIHSSCYHRLEKKDSAQLPVPTPNHESSLGSAWPVPAPLDTTGLLRWAGLEEGALLEPGAVHTSEGLACEHSHLQGEDKQRPMLQSVVSSSFLSPLKSHFLSTRAKCKNRNKDTHLNKQKSREQKGREALVHAN